MILFGHRLTIPRRRIAVLLTLFLTLGFLQTAQATHLRGAVGVASYDPSTKKVTLTSTMVERKDACATNYTGLCTFFAFPTIVQINRATGAEVGKITTCSAQNTALPANPTFSAAPTTAPTVNSSYFDTTSEPLYSIFTTVFVIDVSCAQFSTNFDYAFVQTGSNRIGGIKNTTNQVIEFETRIRIDGANATSSPYYNVGYMTNVAYDTDPTHSFTTSLNALDMSGRSVTYSLVTDQTNGTSNGLGGYGASKIPCSNLNTSTGLFTISAGLCTSSENYVTAFSGGTATTPIYYVLKTKAVDAYGQFTTRDVLLSFASPSNTPPTITRSPLSSSIQLVAGQTTVITYTAGDVDANQTLSFSTNQLPSWATFTQATQSISSGGPQVRTATLTLAPPASLSAAALSIQVSVTDGANPASASFFSLSATNTLAISLGSGLLPPDATGIPSVTGTGSSTLYATFSQPTTGGPVATYTVYAVPAGQPIGSAGQIVGTPCNAPATSCTVSGVDPNVIYQVYIVATNAAGSATSSPSVLTVPVLTMTYPTKTLVVGTTYSASVDPVISSGAAITSYSLSAALPAGLSFNSTTGAITGTPTQVASTVTYTITGTTAAGATATTSFQLTVGPATNQTQTITFPSIGTIYKVSSAPTSPYSAGGLLGAYSSSGLPITYSMSSTSITTSNSYCQLFTDSLGHTFIYYVRSSSTSGSSTCTVYAFQAGGTINGKSYSAATNNPANISVSVNRNSNPTIPLPTASITPSTVLSYYLTAALPSAPLTYSANSGSYWNSCSVSPSLPSGVSWNSSTCNIYGTAGVLMDTATYTISLVNVTGIETVTFRLQIVLNPNPVTYAPPTPLYSGNAETPTATIVSGLNNIVYSTTSSASVCTVDAVTGRITAATVGSDSNCVVTATSVGSGKWDTGTTTATVVIKAPAAPIPASTPLTATVAAMSANTSIWTLPANTGGPATSYALYTKDTSLAVDTTVAFTAPSKTRTVTATNTASGITTFTTTGANLFYPGQLVSITGITSSTSCNATNVLIISVTSTTFTTDAVSGCSNVTGKSGTATAASTNYYRLDVPDGLALDVTTGTLSGAPENFQSATNYYLAFINVTGTGLVQASLTVTALNQTITFPQPTGMVVGDANQPLSATADSGLLVTYTSTTLGVCTVVSGAIHIVTAGTCTIKADVIAQGAYNAASSVSKSITISATLPAPAFSISPKVVTLTVGQYFPLPYTITNTGGAVPAGGYSISPALPAGIYFDPNSGLLTNGAPIAGSAAVTYTVTESNTAGTATDTFTLSVLYLSQTISLSTVTSQITTDADTTITASATSGLTVAVTASPANVCTIVSGKLHAVGYGTCTLTGTQSGNSLYSAASQVTTTVAIHQPPTLLISSNVQVLNKNNSYNSGFYTLTVIGDPATSFTLASGNIGSTGMTFSTSTGLVTGTPGGSFSATRITITATNGYGTSAAVIDTFSATNSTASPNLSLSVTSLVLYVGQAVTNSYTITNTGGVATAFGISPAAPSGLTINSTTGALSGTPTVRQSATTYTLTDTNSAGSATASLTIQIIGPTTFTLSSSSQTVVANSAITSVTASVTSTDTPTAWTISPALPTGLSFNTANGTISGTPTGAQGATTYTVTASNGAGSTSQTFTLTVTQTPNLAISTSAETISVGSAITTVTLTNSGGLSAYSISPTPTSGLTFDPTAGTLSGTPLAAGTYTYIFTATNSSGTSTKSYTLVVNKLPQTVSWLTTLIPSTTTSPFSLVGAATGSGGGAITYSVSSSGTSGCAITGSNLTWTGPGSCVLSATAAAAGNYNSSAATTTNFIITDGLIAPIIRLAAAIETVSVGTAISKYSISNLGGVATGYSISPSPSPLIFDPTNGNLFGTPTTIGTTVYTITESNTAGISVATYTLVVTKTAQTDLIISPTTSPYGSSLALTAVGGSTNGTITYTVTAGTATGCSITGTSPSFTLTSTSAGTCIVQYTMAGNSVYAPVSSVPTTITFTPINQAALNITSVSSVYGNTLTLTTSGGSGPGAVTYAVTNSTGTQTALGCTIGGTAPTFTLTVTQAGNCLLAATKAASTNYLVQTSAETLITFAQAPQPTVTVTPLAGASGGTGFTITAAGGATGNTTTGYQLSVVDGTGTPSCTLSGSTSPATLTSTPSAVGTCIVTATRLGDVNYLDQNNNWTITVNSNAPQGKISIDTTTGNTTGTYPNSITSSITYASTTLVSSTNDTPTVWSGTALSCSYTGTYSGSATGNTSIKVTAQSPGTCYMYITVGGGTVSGTTYNAATSNTVMFTFAQQSQSITTASLGNVTYGVAPILLGSTSSSGLAVQYSATGSCTVSQSGSSWYLTITGAGSCSVTSSQPGNTYYAAATTPAAQTFTIAKANQSITFAQPAAVTYPSAPVTLIASSSSGLTDTFTVSPSSICTISGASVTIVGVGNCSITAYQIGNSNYNAASTVTQTLVVNGPNQSITATAGANGTISPAGVSTIAYNGTQTYAMTPSTGYHVSDVKIDGASVGSPYSYTFNTVQSGHTIDVYFALNSYTITPMVGSHGSMSPSTAQSVINGGSASFTVTADSGYHISDVLIDSSSVGAISSYSFSAVSSDHSIVSIFVGNSYTLGFSTAGSSSGSAPVSQTFTYGNSITIPSNSGALAKSGYSFSGWSTTSGGSANPTYAPGQSYSGAGNLTLYPAFTANNNIISYNGNGSTSGSVPSQTYVTDGSSITIAANGFTRTGYTFSGWGTTAGGVANSAYAPGSSFSTPSSITLYAIWSARTFAITYNGNGSDGGVTPTAQSYIYDGVQVTVAANTFTRSGYSFVGWYSNSSGTGGTSYTAGTSSIAPSVDTVLYALWTANSYTISYNGNGSDGGSTPSAQIYTVGGSAVTTRANTFTRTGYTFSSWYSNSAGTAGNSYSAGVDTVTASADRILYALWSANTYMISYQSGLATSGSAPSSGSFTYGGNGTVASNTNALSRPGYTFAGWNTQSNGTGTNYAVGSTFGGASNLVLYPVFTANTISVTYNSNGATSGRTPIAASFTYPGSVTIASKFELQNSGYEFVGWDTNAFAMSATYQPGDTYSGATSLNLFAIWVAPEFHFIYHSNLPGEADSTSTSIETFTASTVGVIQSLGSTSTYGFIGWATSASGPADTTYNAGRSYLGSADLTLYAQWRLIAFTVAYHASPAPDASYVSNLPVDQNFSAGGTISISSGSGLVTDSTGYTFQGWSTVDGGQVNSAYSPGTSYRSLANLDLYAIWVPKSANSVTYKAGTGFGADYVQVYTGSSTIFAPRDIGITNPTATFLGWSLYPEGPAVTYFGPGHSLNSEDLVFYAIWAPKVLFAYDANGATSGSVPADTYVDSESSNVLFDGIGLTRTGFTHIGWSTTRSGGQLLSPSALVAPTSDTTYYAQWSANQYTIYYDPNTSDGWTVLEDYYTILTPATIGLTPFTRPGYTFAYWSTTPGDITSKVSNGTKFSTPGGLYLWANWTLNSYTITFDANGASGSAESTTATANVELGAIRLPGVGTLAKAGYTFGGWASSNSSSSPISSPYAASATTTLYAIWTPKTYVITYNTNSPDSGLASRSSDSFIVGNTAVTLATVNTLVKTGYTFGGWSAVRNSGTAVASPYTPTSSITLYAIWTANTYIVTYAVNGAAGSPTKSSDNFTVGGSAITLTSVGTMVKSGFTFGGWTIGSSAYSAGDSYAPTASVTATAIWTALTYRITYKANGGSGSDYLSSAFTAAAGTTIVSVATAGFTRTGYTFSGWGDSSTATANSTFAPAATYATAVNLTLYAVWSINSYTISFDSNTAVSGTNPASMSANYQGVITAPQNTGALAKPGYTFAGWNTRANGSGIAVGASGLDTYTVTAATTLYAQWTINVYTISYKKNGAAAGSAPADQTAYYNSTATVADNTGGLARTGFAFAGWNTRADGSGSTYVPPTLTGTFKLAGAGASSTLTVTGDTNLFAQWAPITFSLSYTAGAHGSISGNLSQTVNYGSSGTSVTALPDTTYHFVSWSDGVLTATRTDANATADVTVTANFAINGYTFTYITSAGGSITGTLSQGVIAGANGDTVTAVAVTGAYFTGWSDGVSTASRRDLNATNDLTVTANFAYTTFTITATSDSDGTISPSGASTYNYGQRPTYTFTPNTSMAIQSLVIDGVSQSVVNRYTFDTLTANHTIAVTFATANYTLRYSSGTGGTVDVSSATVLWGNDGPWVTATASSGAYTFVRWSDGSTQNPRQEANVQANVTVSAVFSSSIPYTITSSAGSNGSISPSGSTNVAFGNNQTYTITPNSHYSIATLLVDSVTVSPVSSYTFTEVIANHTIAATFALTQYAIVATATGSGSISPSGTTQVSYGSDQSYSFTPATGYHVSALVIDGSPTTIASTYTFSGVSAAHTIDVTFAIDTFTINVGASANGTISPSSAQVVNYGSTPSFIFAPATGYHVASVSVDSVTVATSTSYTFGAITAGRTLYVTFAIDTFTLSYNPGSGTLSGTTPQTVAYGSSGTQVTAVAPTGYHFTQWSDLVSTASRTDSNLTSNKSVTASYAINTYSVVASTGAHGSISSLGTTTVNYGGSANYTITPASGYAIDVLTVDGNSVPSPTTSYSFSSITANHTISVTFTLITYSIVASVNGSGSITPSGTTAVGQGLDQDYTFAASTGYHILSVLVDGTSASNLSPYTFTNVTSAHTIAVTYAIDTHTLTYDPADGTITGGTSQIVNYGSNGTQVTAVAPTGHHFVQWSDGVLTAARTDSNVTTDISVSAVFDNDTFTVAATSGSNGTISPV